MTGRPHLHRRAERGAILLVAMSFLIVLSLLGALAMRVVQTDIDVAGAERASEHALYVAEAGLAWARQEITDDYWDTGSNVVDTVALFAALGPAVGSGPFTLWRPFGATQPFGSGGSQFTAYILDDDQDDSAAYSNGVFLLRVLGESQGAKRILEVAVMPP